MKCTSKRLYREVGLIPYPLPLISKIEVQIMKYTAMKAGLTALLLVMAMPVMAADSPQLAIMDGTITSVSPVGTVVKEGDSLATVDTLVGSIPAVRSPVDGVVKEVRVTVGQKVKKQDVIVVLETKN